MPAITALPDMPNRGSATFSAEVEAFLGAMPTFVEEANTLAAGLSNASTNSTSSTSLTIALGAQSLTVETGKGYVPGTLVIIANTASPTNWMYGEVTGYTTGTGAMTVNVERMQGSGTASTWTVSLSGPVAAVLPLGGAETGSAVDVTLTAASSRLQAVTMSAADKAVILPDPDTMEEGGPNFIVYKAGGYPFDIKDSDGGVIGRLNTAQFAYCHLIDAATNHWRVAYHDTSPAAGAPNAWSGASSNSYSAICELDATHVLIVYADGGDSFKGKARVLTLAGTTLTAGTAAEFEAGSTNAAMSVAMLTSTLAIVAYCDAGDTNKGKVCCLSVSGTTVTAGTPANFSTADCSADKAICRLSATSAIVAYKDVTATTGKAVAMTISGTTITAGAATQFNAGAQDLTSISPASSTLAFTVYVDAGNSNYPTICPLSVSGTTVTAGSETVLSTTASAYPQVAVLSSTLALATWKATGTGYLMYDTIVLSGSTVSSAATGTLVGSSITSVQGTVVQSSTSAVVLYEDASGYPNIITADVTGTTATISLSGIIRRTNIASTTNHALAAVSSSLVVANFVDSDNGSKGTAMAVRV